MSSLKPVVRITLDGGRVSQVFSDTPVTVEVVDRAAFTKPDRWFERTHAVEVPVTGTLADSLIGRSYRLFPTFDALLAGLDLALPEPTAFDIDDLFPKGDESLRKGWILVLEVYGAARPVAKRNPSFLRIYGGDIQDWTLQFPDYSARFQAAVKALPENQWKDAVVDLVEKRREDPQAIHSFPIPVSPVTLSPESSPVTLFLGEPQTGTPADIEQPASAPLPQTDSFNELLEAAKKDPVFASDFAQAEAALNEALVQANVSALTEELSKSATESVPAPDETPVVAKTAAPKKSGKKNQDKNNGSEASD